jgi:two-component system phosphate regulon sensor histidine kinase PhoR
VREGLRRGTSAFVPEGFVVDVDPPASKATAVREHDVLDGDFGFTIKHEDPEGWIRRSAAKQKLLRGALLVLAVLSGAAGFATFRALRRERTLAALKTDFVANVSHELRTPLASILLLSENLEAGRVASEADRSRYHTLIRREALRLRRLVDDVLDFSRLERGKRIDIRREALRIDPWLERACEELAEWAREHALELSIERSPTEAEAEIDPEALRRALLNLLDNARKHSGGSKVELSATREDLELVLRVRDHGRGISAEDRERVFEPFMRLANGDAPGAGLGLSIVREIAREHGGSVRALDPDDGPGIVFEMRIPLVEEMAA